MVGIQQHLRRLQQDLDHALFELDEARRKVTKLREDIRYYDKRVLKHPQMQIRDDEIDKTGTPTPNLTEYLAPSTDKTYTILTLTGEPKQLTLQQVKFYLSISDKNSKMEEHWRAQLAKCVG